MGVVVHVLGDAANNIGVPSCVGGLMIRRF
jgi:hypothetical protein